LPAVLAWGATGVAAQVNFAQVPCSVCPSVAALSIPFDTANDVQLDPNATSAPQYIGSTISYERDWLGNGYMRRMNFTFSRFDTESSNDTLSFGPRGGTLTTLSGLPSLTTTRSIDTASLQSNPGIFRFNSNATMNRPGVALGTLGSVCCNATPTSTTAVLRVGVTTSVFILGADDTVYTRFTAAGANNSNVVTLRNPTGVIADVYARCNALPTPTTWTYRSEGPTSKFLVLPSTACSGGQWYLAINAKPTSGAGVAELRMMQFRNNERFSLTAGVDFNASAAQMATLATTLRQAAAYFFGATEGTVQVSSWQLRDGTGVNCMNCSNNRPCDLCIRNDGGTGGCCSDRTGSTGIVVAQFGIGTQYFGNAPGVAHEMGHRYLSFAPPSVYTAPPSTTFIDDEYVNVPQSVSRCGHSLMALNFPNLCGAFDHGMDVTPGQTADPGPAAWTTFNANGFTPWTPVRTPDAYHFLDFDGFPGSASNPTIGFVTVTDNP
jgi:hypothetical protein